jgi:hypothetical protein
MRLNKPRGPVPLSATVDLSWWHFVGGPWWGFADRGAWAGFLGNGSRLRGMDMRLTVSVSRGTHSFTLVCPSHLSLIPLRGPRLDLRGVTRLQCVRRVLKLTVYQLVGVDTISRQQTRQYCVFWYGRLITVSYSRALNCPIIPVNWCASFHKRFCISNWYRLWDINVASFKW